MVEPVCSIVSIHTWCTADVVHHLCGRGCWPEASQCMMVLLGEWVSDRGFGDAQACLCCSDSEYILLNVTLLLSFTILSLTSSTFSGLKNYVWTSSVFSWDSLNSFCSPLWQMLLNPFKLYVELYLYLYAVLTILGLLVLLTKSILVISVPHCKNPSKISI